MIRTASSSRVARRYLRAQAPKGSITVNVWDDNPPGAPIMVEGDLPPGADPHGVVDFLAGIAIGAGYSLVAAGPNAWLGASTPLEFHIENPNQKAWYKGMSGGRNSEQEKIHHDFLEEIVALYTGKSYGNHPLYVISES